jgi:hypothetical protein
MRFRVMTIPGTNRSMEGEALRGLSQCLLNTRTILWKGLGVKIGSVAKIL